MIYEETNWGRNRKWVVWRAKVKQIRYFQRNYPKLVLKNYAKDLQPGFPHSENFVSKF